VQQLLLDPAHGPVPDVVALLSTMSDWVYRDFALFTLRSWFRRGYMSQGGFTLALGATA
jgi:hypothetical protein